VILPMARPQRDPDSGIFYLRKRVPRALLPQAKGTTAMLPVGDEHVAVRVGDITKASLRTREPAEAKTRYIAASAALDAHLQAVAAGPVRLNRRQVTAIAAALEAFPEYALKAPPSVPLRGIPVDGAEEGQFCVATAKPAR
jgi:hypothetical protein